jgi:MFS family permease
MPSPSPTVIPQTPPVDKASLATWIAVTAGAVGAFMAILNIQITNASLLDIEGGIGTGVDNGAWISTSYLIGEIIVIPLTSYYRGRSRRASLVRLTLSSGRPLPRHGRLAQELFLSSAGPKRRPCG